MKFKLVCGVQWYQGLIDIVFASDFYACIERCVEWNINSTTQCVGVTFAERGYGPRGSLGGAGCTLRWNWNGFHNPNLGLVNAILLDSLNSTSTSSARGSITPSSGVSTSSGSQTFRIAFSEIVAGLAGVALLSVINSFH